MSSWVCFFITSFTVIYLIKTSKKVHCCLALKHQRHIWLDSAGTWINPDIQHHTSGLMQMTVIDVEIFRQWWRLREATRWLMEWKYNPYIAVQLLISYATRGVGIGQGTGLRWCRPFKVLQQIYQLHKNIWTTRKKKASLPHAFSNHKLDPRID